jgi:hypothetical protein
MSAYDNVVGGKLNLLGGIKKKKKKRVSDEEQLARAAAAEPAAAASSSTGEPSDAKPTRSAYTLGDGHTATEQRRLEAAAKKTVAALERGETTSHREKVRPSTRARAARPRTRRWPNLAGPELQHVPLQAHRAQRLAKGLQGQLRPQQGVAQPRARPGDVAAAGHNVWCILRAHCGKAWPRCKNQEPVSRVSARGHTNT